MYMLDEIGLRCRFFQESTLRGLWKMNSTRLFASCCLAVLCHWHTTSTLAIKRRTIAAVEKLSGTRQGFATHPARAPDGWQAARDRLAVGKLTPLGDPAPNAPKWFAAVEIIRFATDQDWLHKAIKEIAKYWRNKCQHRQTTVVL
jgi:hypothetical protein